jgi:CDP-paratose 2-epimerase
MKKRVLLTGGAGFVGSNLGLFLKRDFKDYEIVALDNLKRRGSELTLNRLKDGGVTFIHGDIRNMEDLDQIGNIDLIIECSAEPSAQAGYDGDPRYLVNTNLIGTINCLEFARKCNADMIFLSSSRVYPIKALRELPLENANTRLIISNNKKAIGWSDKGIRKDFPLNGSRSLYGATKLCSEYLIQEYIDMYGMNAIINRCGVITGPWQMGKVDQGFVTLWAARHFFGGDLSYIGFGGKGFQVRDILHVEDLYNLIKIQIENIHSFKGEIFNAGGGHSVSISLRELTDICRELSGNMIPISTRPETHPADIPYYITDNGYVTEKTGWEPEKNVNDILYNIFEWLKDNKEKLERVLSSSSKIRSSQSIKGRNDK